jgi:hypothetical protein
MKFILSRKAVVQFLWLLSATTSAPGFSLINKDTVFLQCTGGIFYDCVELNLSLVVIKFHLEMFFVPHFLFRF